MPTCAGCGLGVQNKVSACPHCGATPKSSIGTAAIAVAVLGGALVLANLAPLLAPDAKPEAARGAPATVAAKPAPDPASEGRVRQALVVATLIKTGLRDPESVSWQHIRANDDATVVCLEYRARNGFGGLSLERATYAKGRLSNESSAWNKYCAAKKLFDLDHLRESL